MKTRILKALIALALFASGHKLAAQGTAFTYQGRLNDGTNPANGTYNMFFQVYDAATVGNDVGDMSSINVPVTNGLFTVALDFGSGVFTGAPRWLSIGVRTNGASLYTTLAPRQQITPTPYAMYAPSAGVASGVSASAAIQAQSLNIGTNNILNGVYSTIAGGIGNNINGTFSIIGGGTANVVNGTQAIIGGGYHNYITGDYGTVAGGDFNYAGGDRSTVAGGQNNQATGTHAFVGGGSNNVAASDEDVVVGGIGNIASGDPSFIGAGLNNYIGPNPGQATPYDYNAGKSSWIASGNYNTVAADYSGVGGGYRNGIQTSADDSFIGGGFQNIIATALGYSTNNTTNVVITADVISGGGGNQITSATYSFIGGGTSNTIQSLANDSTIGGGQQNNIQPHANWSAILGGFGNIITAQYANIGGGQNNLIQTNASYSAIGGGWDNIINPNTQFSVIGGGDGNYIQFGGFSSTIGGGNNNNIEPYSQGSTIGGGVSNISSNNYATISGGFNNLVTQALGTVPGGDLNLAGQNSFAAGHRAKANNQGDFVWADSQNSDFTSTGNNQFLIRATNGVAINTNNPSGYALNVFGTNGVNAAAYFLNGSPLGGVNPWSIAGSSIYYNGGNVGIGTASPTAKLDLRPIIYSDTQSGGIQMATTDGHWASGIFLRSNSGGQPRLALDSPNFGEALSVFGGNVGIGTTTPGHLLTVGAAAYCDGNTWTPSSDRNRKAGFEPVDAASVLAKVTTMPITSWHYTNDVTTSHIGPMAQDFYTAFKIGADDKHISDVDEGGVALAAIQGLNQKLDEKDTEIQDLKRTVDELKKMMQSLAGKK
jgi:hypothetical protein